MDLGSAGVMSRATSSAPNRRTTSSTVSLTLYFSEVVWMEVSLMPFFTDTTKAGLMKMELSSIVNFTSFMACPLEAMTPAPNPLTSAA